MLFLCSSSFSSLIQAWLAFCTPGGVVPRTGRECWHPQVIMQGAGSLSSWSPMLFLASQCLAWTAEALFLLLAT